MGNHNYIITDIELLKEGANECLDSALDHYEAANLLSEKEMYGIACSHLVLAAEEACKSHVLIGSSIIGNEDQVSFKSLFTSHNTKQTLSKFMSIMNVLFDRTFQELIQWQLDHLGEDLSEEKKRELLDEKDARFDNLKKWLINQRKDKSEIGNIAVWWQHANHLKNSGFYVGYNNSSWLSPQNITSLKYEESFEIVRLTIDKVQSLIKFANEEPELIKEYYDDYFKYLNKDLKESS